MLVIYNVRCDVTVVPLTLDKHNRSLLGVRFVRFFYALNPHTPEIFPDKSTKVRFAANYINISYSFITTLLLSSLGAIICMNYKA